MRLDQIITGAEGFVGTHLCRRLGAAPAMPHVGTLDVQPISPRPFVGTRIDIRSSSALRRLAGEWSSPTLVHLAAMAEVMMPFGRMSDLTATNIQGTVNVLEAFGPRRVVFASSSAVYGTVHGRSARPVAEETGAIGAYGISKRMGEAICTAWAEEGGGAAVALRFGNIVGPGCRGLIPYLVHHAVTHRGGTRPAQLRGRGALVRDYLPVECAVEAIVKAAELPVAEGQTVVFNVGSGRGLTNGEVAGEVAAVLAREGYPLRLDFDNPVPAGESEAVVLDVSATSETLGVGPPTRGDVDRSIEEATLAHLAAVLGRSG